ncbi:MAG: LysR family transcriptional regulator [Catenulispora sp.]|nr:LysR family transcriptional regulator [Catenulispora sp.]
MDLDIAQARAFLAVADRLHFGQAAQDLSLSQQALSKRIARLEAELGVQLFLRTGHAVEMTEAGRRFQEPARQAVAAGDRAVAAARHTARPLRIDYFGHLFSPMRTLRPVLDHLPGLAVETGAARDLPAVAEALDRGATDVGFGRVHRLDGALGTGLNHRLVRLEPLDVVVGPDHELAGRSQARPAELRTGVLWCPAALQRLEFYQRFAESFDLTTASSTANLGLDHLLDQVAADPHRFALLPADIDLPDRARVRCVPLVDPTPLYAWSVTWHRTNPHPDMELLLRAFADIGGRNRWLEYRPAKDWLPDADRESFQTG